jgi:hypothetical protein
MDPKINLKTVRLHLKDKRVFHLTDCQMDFLGKKYSIPLKKLFSHLLLVKIPNILQLLSVINLLISKGNRRILKICQAKQLFMNGLIKKKK